LRTAALMLASAVAAGLSTYLHWLPCRGSMLRGSIIYDNAYVGPKFSAACERRMSGDQGPWELALSVRWRSPGWPGSRSSMRFGGSR
jgi:hypothetical protein